MASDEEVDENYAGETISRPPKCIDDAHAGRALFARWLPCQSRGFAAPRSIFRAARKKSLGHEALLLFTLYPIFLSPIRRLRAITPIFPVSRCTRDSARSDSHPGITFVRCQHLRNIDRCRSFFPSLLFLLSFPFFFHLAGAWTRAIFWRDTLSGRYSLESDFRGVAGRAEKLTFAIFQ